VASAVLAIMVLPALAGPASAASYAWTLTCKADGGSASASWDWLQDGQVIAGAGGTAGCGGSGGGTRPANANGVTVTLTATACTRDCTEHSKSATVSFDPAGGFSLTLKSSAHNSYNWCFRNPIGGEHFCTHGKSSISATFTMTG
jgi:hypothetical protein